MKKLLTLLLLVFVSTAFAVTYYNTSSSKVYVTEWYKYIEKNDTMSHIVYIDTTLYPTLHMLSDSGGVNVCISHTYDTTALGEVDTITVDPLLLRSFTIWGYGKQLRVWFNDTLTIPIVSSGMIYMDCFRTVRYILVTADESYPYEVNCFGNLNQMKGK